MPGIRKLVAFMILFIFSFPLIAVEPRSVQASSQPSEPPTPKKYGQGYVSGKALRSCPNGNLKPVFIPEIYAYGIGQLVDESLGINNRAPHIVMAIDPQGDVIDTRFHLNRGSGDPALDEQIVIWAKEFRFKPDKCKTRRLRFVEQPVVLDLEDKPNNAFRPAPVRGSAAW